MFYLFFCYDSYQLKSLVSIMKYFNRKYRKKYFHFHVYPGNQGKHDKLNQIRIFHMSVMSSFHMFEKRSFSITRICVNITHWLSLSCFPSLNFSVLMIYREKRKRMINTRGRERHTHIEWEIRKIREWTEKKMSGQKIKVGNARILV